jgi:hypothetical protein
MVKMNAGATEASPVESLVIPGVGPVSTKFQRNRQVESGYDVRQVTVEAQFYANWNGLSAVGLYRRFDEQSDVYTYAILFADRPALVRARLNKLGFDVPRLGTLRRVDSGSSGQSLDVGIGVINIDGHPSLECTSNY